MPKKPNYWKQKIDPAFDKVIRSYVDFLARLERHSDGILTFTDDFIEPVIIQKSGWHNLNEEEAYKDLFTFIKRTGGLENKELRLLLSLMDFIVKEDIASLLKIFPEMIKSLPEEESRQFYLDSLKPYENDRTGLNFNSADRKSLDFFSIMLSLINRYLFVKLLEEPKEVVDENIEYFKTSNAVIAFIHMILSSFSQIGNLKALTDIKESISKGDDKAIFKAVTVDKSFLYLDEVKIRVQTAQLTGDTKFFTKLGKAISDNPLKRIGQHGKTYSVLKLYWFTGLYKLTNEELYYLLKSCGLIPPEHPYAFEKFIQRHIRIKLPET